MMLEVVRDDSDYNNGNYVTQPRLTKIASIFFGIATAGGTLNYQSLAPTREKADEFIDMRLASTAATDANDFLWQWSSAADYDASGDLEKIQATVLAINSIDDEVNPPGNGPYDKGHEACEKRQALSHPYERRNERPSHDRTREVLQASPAEIAGRGPAKGHVGPESGCTLGFVARGFGSATTFSHGRDRYRLHIGPKQDIQTGHRCARRWQQHDDHGHKSHKIPLVTRRLFQSYAGIPFVTLSII